MSPEDHRQKSAAVISALANMQEHFKGTIGSYWPFRGEVALFPLVEVLINVDMLWPYRSS
jgi:5-formyltetrahydrofolate cyclo-ligase